MQIYKKYDVNAFCTCIIKKNCLPLQRESGINPFTIGAERSPVSAPALGAGGREFESRHPDQT